jgi:hypothetical protein
VLHWGGPRSRRSRTATGAVAASGLWNPADKAASVTVTVSDTTATKTSAAGTYAGIRSTPAITGKKVFAIDPGGTTANDGFGVANSSGNLASYIGSDAHSIGAFPSGQIYTGNALVDTGDSFDASATLLFALDETNRKFWFKKSAGSAGWNGSGTADPATNTEGLNVPAGDLFAFFVSDAVNAQAVLIAYPDALPSGFSDYF